MCYVIEMCSLSNPYGISAVGRGRLKAARFQAHDATMERASRLWRFLCVG